MADIELDAVYWQETVDGDYQPRLEPADLPDTADILNTANLIGVSGRWQPADASNYKHGEEFGVDGVSETGSLTLSALPVPSGVIIDEAPDCPIIVGIV